MPLASNPTSGLSSCTHSCAGFAVSPMFYVRIVDAGSSLPALIAIQGPGFWTCSNHVESILDAVMSYLNSKICLPVKGSVYLSLSRLKLTRKMEFSPHTLILLCRGFLAASYRNGGFRDFLAGRLLSPPQPPARASRSPLAQLFYVSLSLLAGLPYGQLGLRFMPVPFAAGSRVLSQDTQLWLSLRGGDPQPSVTACRGCQRTSGVRLRSQSSVRGL